jgi:multicomponent Na+:H+ antiporter subunit G
MGETMQLDAAALQAGLVGFLSLAGAGFCFVAALGLLRQRDAFLRMHAASKAGTAGCALALLAAAASQPVVEVAARAALALIFLLITAPIAAHLLGRAAYKAGLGRQGLAVDEWAADGAARKARSDRDDA